jgi:Diacylglycerol kinase catalytic domain
LHPGFPAAAVREDPYSEAPDIFMSKLLPMTDAFVPEGQLCPAQAGAGCLQPHQLRPRVALLSNPKSTGNLAQLPRIREYCADHPDVFHYEVEHAHQIGEAMKVIARVRPKVLAINGGDGTVQAALTELHNGGHFEGDPPPVAVLPSGKTNLIAIDLGARGDPIEALERLIGLARTDIKPHTVDRELIALRHGASENGGEDRPVIGMFLGGAGLAETMLYCRDKIYPLGLPNGLAHVITAIAAIMKMVLRMKASFLPSDSEPLSVSLSQNGERLSGRFSLLAVTTLEKLLLSAEFGGRREGALRLIAIEEHPTSVVRAVAAQIAGKLGRSRVRGVHFEQADEITIEGERSDVILDGETFRAEAGRPIRLRTAQPLSFVKLAA